MSESENTVVKMAPDEKKPKNKKQNPTVTEASHAEHALLRAFALRYVNTHCSILNSAVRLRVQNNRWWMGKYV